MLRSPSPIALTPTPTLTAEAELRQKAESAVTKTNQLLRFSPLSSSADYSFWSSLCSHKLNTARLSMNPIELEGGYSTPLACVFLTILRAFFTRKRLTNFFSFYSLLHSQALN
jgi:hypothetical protein